MNYLKLMMPSIITADTILSLNAAVCIGPPCVYLDCVLFSFVAFKQNLFALFINVIYNLQ